jgi:hypothetical protein
MKFDKDPPIEKTKNEFPSLDGVVTVANCWYYLSLLERFVEITQSMEEDLLKMYLVRAEYRYFQWISAKEYRKPEFAIPPVGKRNNFTISELILVSKSTLLFSDVAFFWQAHLLSPVRYQEDTWRAKIYNPYMIPLEKIVCSF